MLRGEDANEPQQYDTLRGVRGGRGAKTPEQPSEGQYNTLTQVTDTMSVRVSECLLLLRERIYTPFTKGLEKIFPESNSIFGVLLIETQPPTAKRTRSDM